MYNQDTNDYLNNEYYNDTLFIIQNELIKIDNELKIKLDNVKKEVSGMSPSKYNYYRLTELKNGLN